MKKQNDQLIHAISNIAKRPQYTPEKIQRLMDSFGLNERSLAFILSVTPYTVRQWLMGNAKPCSPSSRLLQLLEIDAGMVNELAKSDNAL